MAVGAANFMATYSYIGLNGRRAWYLFSSQDTSDYSSVGAGALSYGEYFILINTLIPISLVVSLEFVKLI